MSYYEVLGIDRSASREEIEAAYRRLAKQHHPDRNPGDPHAAERMRRINEAYATVSDLARRTLPHQQPHTTHTAPIIRQVVPTQHVDLGHAFEKQADVDLRQAWYAPPPPWPLGLGAH